MGNAGKLEQTEPALSACEQSLLWLSQSLDGELSAQEQKALQAHLENCPACRALEQDLERMHSAFSGWSEAEPPQTLKQSVMEGLEPRRNFGGKQVWFRRQGRALAALAACCVLCVGAVRLLHAPAREDQSAADPPVLAAAADVPSAAGEDGIFACYEAASEGAVPAPEAPSMTRAAVPQASVEQEARKAEETPDTDGVPQEDAVRMALEQAFSCILQQQGKGAGPSARQIYLDAVKN